MQLKLFYCPLYSCLQILTLDMRLAFRNVYPCIVGK
jgi:hypothetical protein